MNLPPRAMRVVGVDPEGRRHERVATVVEVMTEWGRWWLNVARATADAPLRVDGYTVWCEPV